MTLAEIDLDYRAVEIPVEVADFLRMTDELVEQHRVSGAMNFRGFVPSDYSAIYQCLKTVRENQMLPSHWFCEWGSGLGVVAALAAMVGFESTGIEHDSELCDVAEQIHADHFIPVEIVNGSFVPEGVEDLIDEAFAMHDGELALRTDADHAYQEIGCGISDFNLIFAYPWPNDVELICAIFDRCAAPGSLLLTYRGGEEIVLQRKH